MAVKPVKEKEMQEGIDFSTLGIGVKLEQDRLELDERGAMQIIQFRIDTRTKYYDKTTHEGGY